MLSYKEKLLEALGLSADAKNLIVAHDDNYFYLQLVSEEIADVILSTLNNKIDDSIGITVNSSLIEGHTCILPRTIIHETFSDNFNNFFFEQGEKNETSPIR